MIPVLVGVSLITFTLMHLVPGGPWDKDKNFGAEVVANLNRRYGLDLPVWMQYLRFLGNALRGDLGVSFAYQDRSVTDIIMGGLPTTATLGGLALLFALVVGIGLGISAALRQNSMIDYVCVFFATIGASVPSFVIGILLVITFSVKFHLLPTKGWGAPEQMIMPVLALGALPASYLARITRASMLEITRQDFIRTARAKGLSPAAVVLGHMVKNMLIPVITVAGPLAAFLITGSFIIETLFSIPGIGRLFVQGVFQRDYGLVMGTTLLYTVVVAVANLLVDLLYAVVDPRIRYS